MEHNLGEEHTHEEGLHKKERAEEKRILKEKARASARSARKVKKMGVRTVIIVMIVGVAALVAYWAFSSSGAAPAQDPSRPGTAYPIEGTNHVQLGAPHAPYRTNPPTSGPHAPSPLPFGIYADEVVDESAVHNLEHGGIWISYKDISDDGLAVLETIATNHPGSVLLSPRSANDTPIAVTSWGRLLTLDAADENAIEAYIQANINKSPEPFAF